MRTTKTDTERYTNGDCLQLAQAIHDLTGWQIVAVLETWTAQGTRWARGHVTVRHPDGDLVDIRGQVDQDQIIAEWDADTVAEIGHIRDLAAYGWGPEIRRGVHYVRDHIDTYTRELAEHIAASV